MNLIQLITNTLPSANADDTLRDILELMSDNHVNALPVVDNGRFVGLALEQILLDQPDDSVSISSISIPDFKIDPRQDIHSLAQIMSDNTLDLVPLVSSDGQYLGSVSIHSVVKILATTIGVSSPGVVISVFAPSIETSLKRIVEIIEDCQACVLSILTNIVDGQAEFIIKLNVETDDAVVSALRRFGFVVTGIASFDETAVDLKRNYDSLMHYLGI